jgi:hypothetical protein
MTGDQEVDEFFQRHNITRGNLRDQLCRLHETSDSLKTSAKRLSHHGHSGLVKNLNERADTLTNIAHILGNNLLKIDNEEREMIDMIGRSIKK